MTVNVCWHEGADGWIRPNARSGYSCCTLLNRMFDRYACVHWSTFAHLPKVEGAVVIIQGGNERDRVAEINRDLATLRWALVIIIGDEGCDFPVAHLRLPARGKLWVQMVEPGVTVADRALIVGYSRNTPVQVNTTGLRFLDWFFAGQDTHSRRHECLAQLAQMSGGVLIPTAGFEQGIPSLDYFAYMAHAKVIPCPSGPASPDSFRFAEALEHGCVPIVDAHTPRYTRSDYWLKVLGPDLPFPVIRDWGTLPQVMAQTLTEWEDRTLQCQRWWMAYKTQFYTWLHEDLQWLIP